jgi:cytochrome P450
MPNGTPPGPKGVLFALQLALRFHNEPLRFALDMHRAYGDLVHLRLGPQRLYLVFHPDAVREVLVTKAKSFGKLPRQKRVMGRMAGNGLVLSEGDFWLRQRRLMQPAFHPTRLKGYADVIVAHTRRRLESWRPGAELNVAGEMTRLSLGIIAKLLFDVDVEREAEFLGSAWTDVSRAMIREMTELVPTPAWLPLPWKLRAWRARRRIDAFIRRVIRERRAAGGDRGDLLSMLLLAVDREGDGGTMTDEQARDEATTLFNGGHDPAAAALAWTWHLLATHPAEQGRLGAEVSAVLGSRPATADDVPRLERVTMAVKEVMRLYPPAWGFPRLCVADAEVGGYAVPRGSQVFVFPYVTHHDARWFPDPERFVPERFAPEAEAKLAPLAYFPFGAGPRVCIGNGLALLEMVLIVATVLQRIRVEPLPGRAEVGVDPLIALEPRGGVWLRVAEPGGAPSF